MPPLALSGGGCSLIGDASISFFTGAAQNSENSQVSLELRQEWAGYYVITSREVGHN
ncbi:hypothetical protein [Bifidobacterium canis]|uniref:Uncharacterized protein n=1 Tax=Bifidobacterium canis TaxID=2610880 RepID=A0A7K1J435_9BIFI|nr:hypothetical protein [Bifidobacterium canis]MUH59413.1 hypothetical protein [Bifidobacterium canis]